MNLHLLRLSAAALLLGASGCSSIYYGAMEKIGVEKRDIMVSRVKSARSSQQEAKQEFASALEHFGAVVKFKGGDLEAKYKDLSGVLEDCEARATDVHERIAAVADVSDALFREWKAELGQYSNAGLRAASQKKYDETLVRYKLLMAAMKRVEGKIEPVLAPLRDQVLFLKHNLNAQAIASLSDELTAVETNVGALLRDMEVAIAEADRFIATMDQK